MYKKTFVVILLILAIAFIAYKLGYNSGCAKVVGNWEGAYITDDIMRSYCYGDRNMWRDDIDRKTQPH